MRFTALYSVLCIGLSVYLAVALVGCDETPKENTIKGVLIDSRVLPIEERPNNTAIWHELKFQDGQTVLVGIGPGDTLYYGHYQEIETDELGYVVRVECESFDKMLKARDQEPNQELLSEWNRQYFETMRLSHENVAQTDE